MVVRQAVLARLAGASGASVVVAAAPAGYGKSTVLSQWVAEDGRPHAWLSVSDGLNEPLVFASEIALALGSVGALDARTRAGLTQLAPEFESTLIPRLVDALEAIDQPFVLVLDDAHRLVGRQARAVLRVVAERLPDGSQLAVGTRSDQGLPLHRLRADGRVFQLGAGDLEMTAPEASALLRLAGADLDEPACSRLHERTEGWAAGLYLVALIVRDAADPLEAAERFAGDDRAVADYFRDEVLRSLPRNAVTFLRQASILDAMSGPLCDAVLERSDSAAVLESIERSKFLPISVDANREWYRCHRLLADTLRSELHRREPTLEIALHSRASSWFESNGDITAAIEHARAAGDKTRVETLIWRAAPSMLDAGDTVTLSRWLDPYAPSELASRPALAVAAALRSLGAGEMNEFVHLASVVSLLPADERLPDGTPIARGHGAVPRDGRRRRPPPSPRRRRSRIRARPPRELLPRRARASSKERRPGCSATPNEPRLGCTRVPRSAGPCRVQPVVNASR